MLGEAKVSSILLHCGVHLILAYSWARPAMLAAGGGMLLFLPFLLFHSFSSFSAVPLFDLAAISLISFLPFSGRQHKITYKG